MYSESDRRQYKRATVNLAQHQGKFELEVDGSTLPILGSNNISISGMDIKTSEAIKPSANIRLHFKTSDLHLAVNGHVAWCASPEYQRQIQASNTDAYAMGIEFDPETLDDNSLLFLALRQYVDNFE